MAHPPLPFDNPDAFMSSLHSDVSAAQEEERATVARRLSTTIAGAIDVATKSLGTALAEAAGSAGGKRAETIDEIVERESQAYPAELRELLNVSPTSTSGGGKDRDGEGEGGGSAAAAAAGSAEKKTEREGDTSDVPQTELEVAVAEARADGARVAAKSLEVAVRTALET